MHPAPSIIFFTVISGCGYGLLMLLGLHIDTLPFGIAITAMIIGFILVSLGLLSSLFHLSHPERAWRALSQWRSSWLSREGVMAIITYIPIVAIIIMLLLQYHIPIWLGLILSICAMITVFATSMIYGSLKPVARWSQPLTPYCFLALSILSGILILNMVFAFFGVIASQLIWIQNLCAIVAFYFKLRWFLTGDRKPIASDIGAATGLSNIKASHIKPFDPPHHAANYLMREMGFVIARKHAQFLRYVMMVLLLVSAPLGHIILFIIQNINDFYIWYLVIMIIMTISIIMALFIERWLFFAEAKHTVSLYY